MSGKKGFEKKSYQVLDETGAVYYQCVSKPESFRVFHLLDSVCPDHVFSVIQVLALGSTGSSGSKRKGEDFHGIPEGE